MRHKKYGKFISRSSVFKAHDEKNAANVLKAQLENKKLARTITDGIVELVGGEEHLILNKRAIRNILQELFEHRFGILIKKYPMLEASTNNFTESIGTFGVQSKSLQDLSAKINAQKGADVEDENEEDEENNEENE